MATTLDFLKHLLKHEVTFVVVGGMAGVLHGSRLVTEDLDVCAPLTQENLSRICDALRHLHPRFRMSPNRPPLPDQPAALNGFRNLYLITDMGQIDILSEIAGVGGFAETLCHAVTVELGGMSCKVLDLDALIRSKRALGRPRDLQAAVELEAIRARRMGG